MKWRERAGSVGICTTITLVVVAVLFQIALRAWRGPTHQHSAAYVNLMLLLLAVSMVSCAIDRASRFAALMVSAWGSWVVLVTLALLDIDRGQYPVILSILAGGGAILGTSVGKRWMLVYLVLTVVALMLSAFVTGEYDGATVASIVCIGAGVGAWLIGDKFDEIEKRAGMTSAEIEQLDTAVVDFTERLEKLRSDVTGR